MPVCQAPGGHSEMPPQQQGHTLEITIREVTLVARVCDSCLKKFVSKNQELLDCMLPLELSSARRSKGHLQSLDSLMRRDLEDAVKAKIISPREVDGLNKPGRLGKSDRAVWESLWKKGIIPKLRSQRLGLDRATFF